MNGKLLKFEPFKVRKEMASPLLLYRAAVNVRSR